MTTTRFEDTEGVDITTLDDEAALLTALGASGRVTVTTLGMSSHNVHPVQLVTVDTPNTPALAPSVLWVGGQHGNEHVSREVILSTLRDLAESADPDTIAFLDHCRVHAIPTANPQGFPTTRSVPGRGNMNREHLSLVVTESRHVQQAITDLDPALVVDCHEQFGAAPTSRRVEMLPGRHPMSDDGVTAVSESLLSACQSALDDADIVHGPYTVETNDPWTLRGMSSLRNIPFLLVETPALNDIIPKWERFRWYKVTRDAILGWLDANAATALAAKRAAETAMAARGLARDTPFNLNTTVLDPPPVAYQMPAPAPFHLDVFGLDYTEQGGTVTVPVAQGQHSLVPFLLDPEGPEPAAVATRVSPPRPRVPVPPFVGVPVGLKVRLDGITYDVDAMKVRLDGVTYEASLPAP